MEILIRVDMGHVWGAAAALLAWGVLYNAMVAEFEKRGLSEGFVSLLVAWGCAITLMGVAVISQTAALICLAAFACSGTPMMIGSIWRYARRREQERQRLLEEVLGGDQAKGVAKRGKGS
jgi:hypothetical protein